VPGADPRERLVFLRAGSVWMADGGGAPVQLTVRPSGAPDERPTLSPDGRVVAFASAQDGVRRIHIMVIDELLPQAVSDGKGGGDGEPAFSPDGKTLYFMRGDPRSRKDLVRVDLAAARAAAAAGEAPPAPETILAGDDDAPEEVGGPVVSPDGRGVVLSADRRAGHGTGLVRVDLATRKLSRITAVAGPGAIDRDPAFSPGGRRIAFASNRHDPRDGGDDLDLYAVSPDGSRLVRLTDDPGAARDPAYGPDGRRLYFTSTRDRASGFEQEIYVMAAGGGVQRRLTRDDRPENAAPFAGRRPD
jgi:Tol biopolymer transport system component